MFAEKLLQISIFLSLITHGAILSQSPDFKNNAFPKREKALEVTYLKNAQAPKSAGLGAAPKREPLFKLSPNLSADKRLPPAYIDKEKVFLDKRGLNKQLPDFAKPAFIKSDLPDIKKKITLPPVTLEKINNPSYTSYYQFLREKIKRAAYQNYNSSEVGEVTLAFIVSRAGSLRELRLSEDSFSISPALKEIAARSVKEASPFPTFPKELDYLELPFKLTIIFEVE